MKNKRKKAEMEDLANLFTDEFKASQDYDRMMNWLTHNNFFDAPASTKYHGSFKGGLFQHSYMVAETLCKLTKANDLVWQRPDSPAIVGILHDICKCDAYEYSNGCFLPNNDMMYKGHGDKSVILCSSIMALTPEETACIRYHMGAFVTDELNLYSNAVSVYENVLWTHHADMIASQVKGI